MNRKVAELQTVGFTVVLFLTSLGNFCKKDWKNLMEGWQQILGNLLNNRNCPEQGVEIFGMAGLSSQKMSCVCC